MRDEMPGRAAKRLLARIKRIEEAEALEEARDEAQKLLLARHLLRVQAPPPGGLDVQTAS